VIIYSRFNCRHYCIEHGKNNGKISARDLRRAVARMNNYRMDEEWLRKRLELFHTFTLPSVLSQTHQKFIWIGIAHPDSPPWFLDALKKVGRMKLAVHEWDIDAKMGGGHTSINLDTDDAIARDFVKRARQITFPGETIFSKGLKYRPLTDCWLSTRSPNAHFNIVKHPELSVLDFSHGMGFLPKNIVRIREPMWLEVIHEKNIANKLRKPRKSRNLSIDVVKKHFDLNYKSVLDGNSII
jgi:hypothetical protein